MCRQTIEEKVTRKKTTTLLKSSRTDERHPEDDPQTPGGAIKKLGDEASEGDTLVEKAKHAIEEVDRQIGGEYERREDPTPP